jgi:exopolysaccharide biosynthesis polyprenyl glycosylphosphotransferase
MRGTRKSWLVFGDILGFFVGFFAFILIAFPRSEQLISGGSHLIPLSILSLIWVGVFFIFNFYDLENSKPNLIFLRNFFIAAMICLGIGFIFFYINPTTSITPKTNLLIFEGISFAIILGWRRLFYSITSRRIHTKLAIVCNDERHKALLDEINNNPHLGYQCVGTYSSLAEFKQSHSHVDVLVIHKTAMDEAENLESLLASPIHVMDLAEAYEVILYKIPVHFINTHWIIHSISKRADAIYLFASRIIAIIFAVAVIITTFPITLITAFLVWYTDRGPILIRQDRTGLHGKPFKLYKFRSMIALGPDGQAESGKAVWSTGDHDPRITPVGKIIRKLHIDEIPQMINLLKGDLSLVGPRPERPEFVSELEQQIPYYFMRHTIKPGFTGWAQIKFRYARTVLDSEEKFEYDLFYIKNRNFFLDIGIILKTAQIVFTHAGK